ANATLADFIDSLASGTERDVHAWADAWLRTTGVDTLTPEVDAHDGHWDLGIQHRGSAGIWSKADPTEDRDGLTHLTTLESPPAVGPHRIPIGPYDHAPHAAGRVTPRDRIGVARARDSGGLTSVSGPRPALVLLNDGDFTYAKVRFDAESLDTVRTSLSGLP